MRVQPRAVSPQGLVTPSVSPRPERLVELGSFPDPVLSSPAVAIPARTILGLGEAVYGWLSTALELRSVYPSLHANRSLEYLMEHQAEESASMLRKGLVCWRLRWGIGIHKVQAGGIATVQYRSGPLCRKSHP